MKTIQKMLVGIAMMLLGIAIIVTCRPINGATTSNAVAVLLYIGTFLVAAGFFKVIYHRAAERDKEKETEAAKDKETAA